MKISNPLRQIKRATKKMALMRSNAVLIAGTGRNGTTFLARALQQLNPDIQVGHEIDPNGLGLQYCDQLTRRNSIIDGRGRFACKNVLEPNKPIAVIESNGYLTPVIDDYRSLWASCLVIGVIRDWQSCMTSMASQSFPNQPHFFYSNHDPQNGRRPDPVRLNLMTEEAWENFDRLEKIAWYWSYTNGLLLENAKDKPKTTLLIDFKDLEKNAQAVLDKIQDFIQLPRRELREEVAKSDWKHMKQKRINLNDIDPTLYARIESLVKETSDSIEEFFQG